MIRRFLCAVVSTSLSLFITPLILPVCTLLSLSFQLINHFVYPTLIY
jgi:hypothetical protein